MTDRTLTVRELNRATLARQMLLEREALAVTPAVERFVGLQAQACLATLRSVAQTLTSTSCWPRHGVI
jgi:hypothetical protein